jgi:DNA-binding transcriptional ArsR family regulator
MDQSMQPPKTLRSDGLQAIKACAGWNRRLASRRISRFLEKRMIGSGLTIAQFGLMAQIAAASDDTLGALAERLGLDQSSLSRNLHALERDGLVEIAVVERDQRKRAVWLIENGARSPGSGNAGLAARTRCALWAAAIRLAKPAR